MNREEESKQSYQEANILLNFDTAVFWTFNVRLVLHSQLSQACSFVAEVLFKNYDTRQPPTHKLTLSVVV